MKPPKEINATCANCKVEFYKKPHLLREGPMYCSRECYSESGRLSAVMKEKWDVVPTRMAACHSNKKHYSGGLCLACYSRQYKRTDKAKEQRQQSYRSKPTSFHVAKRRKSRYGLTEDQYNAILNAQRGVCAICKELPESGLVIDHNHSTGEVRGLICDRCNLGLGRFKDSIELLAKAVEYLTAR